METRTKAPSTHGRIKVMNEDIIQDLKQFITATIMQQTSDLRTEIVNLDSKLSNKIDDLSASVGDAIESVNESTDAQLKDHEVRIARLEHKLV